MINTEFNVRDILHYLYQKDRHLIINGRVFNVCPDNNKLNSYGYTVIGCDENDFAKTILYNSAFIVSDVINCDDSGKNYTEHRIYYKGYNVFWIDKDGYEPATFDDNWNVRKPFRTLLDYKKRHGDDKLYIINNKVFKLDFSDGRFVFKSQGNDYPDILVRDVTSYKDSVGIIPISDYYEQLTVYVLSDYKLDTIKIK